MAAGIDVPLPRRPLLTYSGCFAPNSKRRSAVVAAGDKPRGSRKQRACKREASEDDEAIQRHCRARCCIPPGIRAQRACRATAIKRSWQVDILQCPCGGRRKVLAAVQDAAEVQRFLAHLNLWPIPEEI